MAGTAARARVGWQAATVTGVAEETASVRTIELQVPGWPGHGAGHLDLRLTGGGASPGWLPGLAPRCARRVSQVLRSQATLKPLPPLFSAPGWASTLPELSTMVISSSVNEEMTPDADVFETVAPDSVNVPKSESG